MTDKNKKLSLMSPSKEGFFDFDRIYARYFTPLYRYILSQTKNRETSEDIIQGVFLKILKNNPRSLPPLAYFFTAARHSIIDHWKKKKEIVLDISTLPFSALIDEKENLPAKIDLQLDSDKISAALEKLSYEQKETLTLRFLSGLTNKEIAQMLDKSEEAVRQIQYRGIQKLRTIIKN